MLLLVMFTFECPEFQTYHLLYLLHEGKMKRINSGLMIMIFPMVGSGVANARNAVKYRTGLNLIL